jgi:hypothetical protein
MVLVARMFAMIRTASMFILVSVMPMIPNIPTIVTAPENAAGGSQPCDGANKQKDDFHRPNSPTI